MIEQWTPTAVILMVVLFPLLVVIGMALVPIIIGIATILIGCVCAILGFAWLPFQLAYNGTVKWNDRRKAKAEEDEIERWGRENKDALDFARKNPGGIYDPKGEGK